MADKLTARVVAGVAGEAPYLELTARDPALAGKRATVEFALHGDVTRGGGKDVLRPLGKAQTVVLSAVTAVELPEGFRDCYRYQGKDLKLTLRAAVSIADGVVFNTKESFDLECPWFDRPCAPVDVSAEVEPRDKFSFLKNLAAIPHDAKMKVIAMAIVGGIVIAVNMIVGTRDQFVPESQTWFYDHSGSEGKSESPLEKALMGSGALGAGIWFAIRAQLRRYIKLSMKKPQRIERDTRVAARDLIAGMPHVRIDFATVRVVAYNRERGRYEKKNKKNTSTHSFAHPIRSVCLYKAEIAHLPAKVALETQLFGDIEFGRAYDELLPPLNVDEHTGIDVAWELQLIHKDFVDHEIAGAADVFDPLLFHPPPR